MEGTTIGRTENEGYPTESDLETALLELFRQTTGMPLVWCSGQNIDRIVTVYRACKKADRQFIIDMYTAEVLRATGNPNVPQASWSDIRVFLPISQKWRIIESGRFDITRPYRADRVYRETLAVEAPHSVMLFRPSMARELEQAGCLNGARLICSLWHGYLKDERNPRLLDWLGRHRMPIDHCHTSGHATVQDLVRLRNAFANAPVVPIHSEEPEQFEKVFENVQQRRDGELWDVFGMRPYDQPNSGGWHS